MLALNNISKSLKGSKILLVGLAYKKNVDDPRESPSFILWKKLESLGADVDYYDPHIPVVGKSREHSSLTGIESKTLDEISAANYDLALTSTGHDGVDYQKIAESVKAVVDTRNVYKEMFDKLTKG